MIKSGVDLCILACKVYKKRKKSADIAVFWAEMKKNYVLIHKSDPKSAL